MEGGERLGAIFSRNLRLMREGKGVRQRELAALVGVSPLYLRWLEGGERTPTLGLLGRLAEALEVPPWTLLCEDGDLVGGDGGWADAMGRRFREELGPLVDELFADARRGRHI